MVGSFGSCGRTDTSGCCAPHSLQEEAIGRGISYEMAAYGEGRVKTLPYIL